MVTVDLDSDPALLAASLRELRVFAGYAGWGAGQLEGEVAVGAWYVVESLPLDALRAQRRTGCGRLLLAPPARGRCRPWRPALVDPTMN